MEPTKGAVKTGWLSPSSPPLALASQGQCIYISSRECVGHREKGNGCIRSGTWRESGASQASHWSVRTSLASTTRSLPSQLRASHKPHPTSVRARLPTQTAHTPWNSQAHTSTHSKHRTLQGRLPSRKPKTPNTILFLLTKRREPRMSLERTLEGAPSKEN